MLELLFQGLDQTFGPALTRLAAGVYWSSLLLLAVACLVPLYVLWRDYYAERLGLVRRWVITCERCRQPTFVTGTRCGYCDAELHIPWSLRGLVPIWSERHGKLARHLRRAGRLGGLLGFLSATVIVLLVTGSLGVEGALPRLFVGVSLLAWTAFGRLAARTVRLEGGLAGRVSEALMAAVALLVFVGAAFLADAARSQDDTRLLRLTSSGNLIQVGRQQTVAVPIGEVRFE
jgi:hypothetical protein